MTYVINQAIGWPEGGLGHSAPAISLIEYDNIYFIVYTQVNSSQTKGGALCLRFLSYCLVS